MNVPSQQNLNVLVVDDEVTVRSVLCHLLEALGFHGVVTAENGEQALDLLGANSFDCAFLDMIMPGLSGLGLLDKILEKSPKTSVIVVTGYPSMELATDAIRRGALHFLSKPFRLDDLRLILQRLLPQEQS